MHPGIAIPYCAYRCHRLTAPTDSKIDTEGGVGAPPAVRSVKSVGGSSICGPRIQASLFRPAPTDFTDSRRPQIPQIDTEGGVEGPSRGSICEICGPQFNL